jgi:hypothetical protein
MEAVVFFTMLCSLCCLHRVGSTQKVPSTFVRAQQCTALTRCAGCVYVAVVVAVAVVQ